MSIAHFGIRRRESVTSEKARTWPVRDLGAGGMDVKE